NMRLDSSVFLRHNLLTNGSTHGWSDDDVHDTSRAERSWSLDGRYPAPRPRRHGRRRDLALACGPPERPPRLRRLRHRRPRAGRSTTGRAAWFLADAGRGTGVVANGGRDRRGDG